ncbi:MAG: AraC family transcriptional regulator [Bacteroidota bacterium]
MNVIQPFINHALGKIDRSSLTQFEGTFLTQGVSLKVPLTGTIHYEVEGKSYRAAPGQFCLMDQYTLFTGVINSAHTQTGICIDIPLTLIQDSLRGFDQEMMDDAPEIPLSICSLQHYRLASQVHRFAQEITIIDWEQAGPEILCGWAEKIGALVLRVRGEQMNLNVKKASTRHEIFRRLQIALSYLHDHRDSKFSLDVLAQHTGMSTYHLARNFKQCFGQTLFQYHESLKMQYAFRQLQTHDIQVAELALALGYEEPSYFIRRFKQHFGQTPGKI